MVESLLWNIKILWILIGLFFAAVIGSQTWKVLLFMEEGPKYGFETQSFSDLKMMLVALFFISVYRNVTYNYVKPQIEKRLKSIEQDCPESKIDKCCRAFVGIFWYAFTTLYGFVIFYRHPYIPKAFLGSGKCRDMASGWPTHKMTSNEKWFYMTMFAHHVHSLLELLHGIKLRTDIVEMMLHHCATVSAMMFTYYGNHFVPGVTVLIAHNIGDVLLNVCKFVRDAKATSYSNMNYLFIALIFSWFIPRVVLISTCVLPSIIYTRFFEDGVYDTSVEQMVSLMTIPGAFIASMVTLIMCLNLSWSYLMARIAYNKVMLAERKFEVKGDKAH